MSIFRITSLIVVLMGVLDFKSCPSSVEKAGVTETQVIDLGNRLKSESKNSLEYADKISKIAKIADKINTIAADGSNRDEVVSEAIKKVEDLADSSDVIKDNLPKITKVIENVVVAPQEQSQTVIQIPQVSTEGIVLVEVPAEVEPVIVNPPVEIDPIQEEEGKDPEEDDDEEDLDEGEYDDEEIEEEDDDGEDEEELTPDQMVERAFSGAEAATNAARQAFGKVKSASQKLQNLILGDDITSSDNINSLLKIITNAIQERKDARIELSSIVGDLDEYMDDKFRVASDDYDGYENGEVAKEKLKEMGSFYHDIDCIGYEISEELDKMLLATKDKIASAISKDGESIKMLEQIKEFVKLFDDYKNYLKSREKQRASLINSN